MRTEQTTVAPIIRDVLLRIKAQKSGVRLWDASRVRGFIQETMEAQQEAT